MGFKGVAVVVVLVAAASGAGYGMGRITASSRPTRPVTPKVQLPAAPANWVPFQADGVTTELAHPPTYQKFYRSSDGSTRFETHSPELKETLITIHNLITGLVYMKNAKGEWRSMPTEMKTTPVSQPVFRTDWITTTPEQLEGLETYRLKKAGSVEWLARELNYFVIRMESSDGARARVREYRNITIGEPPHSLFLPPAGAVVENVSKAQELLGDPSKAGGS
jgi:hypothetical protein